MADTKHPWTNTDWNTAFDDAITKGLTAIGIALSGLASRKAPVKTGRLAGSITYAVHGQKEDAASIPQAPAKRDDVVSMPATFHTLYVGTNVEYAPYVEYGYKVHVRGGFWRKEGRRFLTEAFDESKSKFQGTLNKAIHAAVLKHGK